MDAELKSTEPDHMKEKGAANIAHPRDGGSQSGSFGPGGDRTVYPSNIYAPQAQAFYYRGYESAAGEWDEYPPYINSEGLEIGSPGVYNDNPSLFFHSGYGYNPQMPYGPYSPVTTPLPSGGGDPQLYMPQQFQFSGPPYYQHLVPPSMPYIASQVPVSQPELTTLVSVDQQQGDSMLFRPRPNYPPMGSFGRGSLPANPGIIGFHDFPWGFDGLRSGGGLWSDWSKPVDRQNSFSTFSPVLSPQPISTIGLLGQNTRMGSQQQRSSYSPGNSTNSYNRFHPPSALNQGSSTGTALISSFGENNRGWIPLENARDRARVNGGSLCSCNGTLDILSEQNKGPRASRPQSQVASENNSMDNVKQRTSTGKIHDEMYNRPDFITEYKDGRFFIIKSYTEDNVHKSIKYGVWASTPNGNRKLDAAYHGSKEKQDACLVFLFFSVNASAQFCGVAEMVGPVDFDKSVDYWQQDKWSGQFPVKWHIIKDVPNSQFRHITLENNENKPVTNSRDTQEVKLEQGIEMLNIFKSYETEMSILDDFTFYEGRQKAMQERKARQQASMISAGTAGENEQRNAAFLPGDVVKQMSKSFAEVVRLDGLEEVGNKEAATDTSRVIKTGDDNGGLTEAAAVSSFAQSS